MKYFLKYFALFLFFFTTLLFQFCDNGCGGSNSNTKHVVESYLYGTTMKMGPQNQLQAFTGDSIIMSANDTVYISLFAKTRVASLFPRLQEGGLYACSPVEPVIRPLKDSIKIFVLDSFDAAHPAGAEIGDLFFLYEFNSFIPEKNCFPLSQYNREDANGNSLKLALIKKPAVRQVRFRFYFYSGVFTSSAKSTETPVLNFY